VEKKEAMTNNMRTIVVVLLCGAFSAPASAQSAKPAFDTAAIEQLTGAKGAFDASEGVFKVSLPRSDIKATVSGVHLSPPLGLTAWAAFTQAGKHLMVMGDIVLLEGQVAPVMSIALDNGLEVTALHNHFLGDNPKVMFMHVGGMGEVNALAGAIGKIFARLKDTESAKSSAASADIDPAKTTLNPAKIEAVPGDAYKGELANGVYKIVVGRTTKMGGHTMGKAMGVNTWAAFAGSDDKAVVDGDFAVLETELQNVLKALRAGGIEVVAIHNHMTGETPRMLFLHYWGIGSTEALSGTLKAALLKTQSKVAAR
jgi:hypothetical protein